MKPASEISHELLNVLWDRMTGMYFDEAVAQPVIDAVADALESAVRDAVKTQRAAGER